MNLEIPVIKKASHIRVNDYKKEVPKLSIEKGTFRIRLNKTCEKFIDAKEGDFVQIGFEKDSKKWFLFKNNVGEPLRKVPIKKSNSYCFMILSQLFCELLRSHFSVETNAGLPLFLKEPIFDKDGIFFELSR